MYVADGAGVAAGGGAFVVLTIVSVLGRGAILAARAHRREQVAERRHQETLAALRGRHAPAAAAPAPAPVRRPTPQPAKRPTPVPAAAPKNDTLALVERATTLVVTRQDGTPAMLQRELRVSVVNAVALLNVLEQRRIVGPGAEFGSPRDVLVKPDGLDAALARIRTPLGETPEDRRGL